LSEAQPTREANEREFRMTYRSIIALDLSKPDAVQSYCAGARRLSQLVDEWEIQQ